MGLTILPTSYLVLHRVQGLKLGGAEGSLECSCSSLKYMQGAQICIVWYTEHFYEAYEDAIGLPGKNLNFEPWSTYLSTFNNPKSGDFRQFTIAASFGFILFSSNSGH